MATSVFKKIQKLYSDDQILIVNKPAGLLSIPDRFNSEIPNLRDYLKRKCESIYTVHRLDAHTSGIMCFALTAESHKALSALFENREVDKKYLAITRGTPVNERGTIEAPISPNPALKGTMRVHRKGKASTTHYKVVERLGLYSLLELKIETGRTHQIRVHLEYLGYPLLVDPVYGGKEYFKLSEIKPKYKWGKWQETEPPLISRCSLHASHLGFVHPVTGEKMSFEAPLPKDMKAVLNQMRKLAV